MRALTQLKPRSAAGEVRRKPRAPMLVAAKPGEELSHVRTVPRDRLRPPAQLRRHSPQHRDGDPGQGRRVQRIDVGILRQAAAQLAGGDRSPLDVEPGNGVPAMLAQIFAIAVVLMLGLGIALGSILIATPAKAGSLPVSHRGLGARHDGLDRHRGQETPARPVIVSMRRPANDDTRWMAASRPIAPRGTGAGDIGRYWLA